MSGVKDDLEAVRVVVKALESFSNDERGRILRWSAEKLGMPEAETQQVIIPQASTPQVLVNSIDSSLSSPGKRIDLKSFVAEKQPSNDVHFATTIAYYYAFEAAEGEKRSSISSEDLQNACRLTGRERLQNPGQTLRNACFRGFLDKGDERGQYRLNTVGENLVAVTLPGSPDQVVKKRKTPKKKKAIPKKKAASKKKSTKKK